MVKKFLGFFALILVMATALIAYSMTNTAPDIPNVHGTVDSYKQKLFAKTKEIAAPVLKKAGIDVEQIPQAEDLNVVEKQMEEATDKVNEATKALSQTP